MRQLRTLSAMFSKLWDGTSKGRRRRAARWRWPQAAEVERLEARQLLTNYLVNTTSDIVANDGFTSLREAVRASSTNAAAGDASAGSANGDTISFAAGLTNARISLTNGDLSISDDLVVNGQNRNITLDGLGQDRVLTILTSEAVRLNNLTLTNGTAPDVGGAIRTGGGGSTYLTSVTITNSTAHGNGGGGIYNTNSALNISGSSISGNKADGASGSGGGIFSAGGSLNVRDSNISRNTANRAGGGLEVGVGSVQLYDTILSENSVAGAAANPGNGGALHVTGAANVQIVRNTISNNTAASEGGGLWNSATGTMNVRQTTLNMNTATGSAADEGGGGIFNNGGTLYVNQSTVSNNKANGAAGSGGGIFSVAGTTSVRDSNISRNSANRAGGGVEVLNGSLQIYDSVLTENSVASPTANPGNGGAIHVTAAANVQLYRDTISNNTAESEGGGLWNSATGTMNVFQTTVNMNSAFGGASDDGGGGIFNNGGKLTVNQSTVIDNNAEGAAGSGGGIFSVAGAVNIRDSNISRNTANRAGGGLEIVTGTVQIFDSVLTENNVAGTEANPGNGGAIHVTGAANVQLYRDTISDNRAASEGGGLWNQIGATMLVVDSTITGNLSDDGGGIFNNGGTLTVRTSKLTSNTSTGNGGAVSLAAGSSATITDSEISQNVAVGNGGGIYNAGKVRVQGGKIVFNRAADGGGIFTEAGATTELSAVTISDNSPDNIEGPFTNV